MRWDAMDEQDSRHSPIAEDMRFQQASWIAERVGWVILAAIALLALAGVFSEGYLSHQVLRQAATPMTIEYERFQRAGVLTRFLMQVREMVGDEVRLKIGNSFQDAYEVDSIVPRPIRTSAGPDGLDLHFERPEFGDLTVVTWARPRRLGLVDLTTATDRGETLKFPVMIYP
jgi:hypothetical protein